MLRVAALLGLAGVAWQTPSVATAACSEMLIDSGWDHVSNRDWHSSCTCSDTGSHGINIVCSPDDSVTELTMDASQLYLSNPNHGHVLNEIRIGGSASLVRVWANWSSTVARHPSIQGNAALVRADIDAGSMSITAEGYVRGNPSLQTLNFDVTGFQGTGSMGRSVDNPSLETNIARVFCAEMLSDYGWDHVPDRTWHPSCACSDTANAAQNFDGAGFNIACRPEDTV